ncbi:hypothetical protein PORCRE_164 [Porphyromonas crevioricanis JCM 15906]|uniref:Uncharacterized protein n=1 Tax=Porphyromonas crevioricanis JCM 15906 TaxID=1305617 RepID=S4PG73_9PORP|nr:hypothetical protein PORCRE_164 [Porphyromonas crevioricanis JCM 15906]GAD07065.1 hypothetical protein PORCAN_679 [Porphyromonas crevioricanis JCM 13913]
MCKATVSYQQRPLRSEKRKPCKPTWFAGLFILPQSTIVLSLT